MLRGLELGQSGPRSSKWLAASAAELLPRADRCPTVRAALLQVRAALFAEMRSSVVPEPTLRARVAITWHRWDFVPHLVIAERSGTVSLSRSASGRPSGRPRLAEIPPQPRHDPESLAGDRSEQVLVRRVLRARQ